MVPSTIVVVSTHDNPIINDRRLDQASLKSVCARGSNGGPDAVLRHRYPAVRQIAKIGRVVEFAGRIRAVRGGPEDGASEISGGFVNVPHSRLVPDTWMVGEQLAGLRKAEVSPQ